MYDERSRNEKLMERIIILEYIKVVVYRARAERGGCSINPTAVTLDFAASKSIFRLKSNACGDAGNVAKQKAPKRRLWWCLASGQQIGPNRKCGVQRVLTETGSVEFAINHSRRLIGACETTVGSRVSVAAFLCRTLSQYSIEFVPLVRV